MEERCALAGKQFHNNVRVSWQRDVSGSPILVGIASAAHKFDEQVEDKIVPTPQEVLAGDVHHDIDMHVPWLQSVAKGNIFEIGVRTGISTAAFLVGLEQNGGHLYSVDIEEQCGQVVSSPDWTFIHDSSRNVEVVKAKIPAVLDILFVDGDHTYEGTRDDFTNYAGLVRSGGLIICHDVCSGYDPGVQQAFYEFFASMPQKTDCVMTVVKSWVGLGYITVP